LRSHFASSTSAQRESRGGIRLTGLEETVAKVSAATQNRRQRNKKNRSRVLRIPKAN